MTGDAFVDVAGFYPYQLRNLIHGLVLGVVLVWGGWVVINSFTSIKNTLEIHELVTSIVAVCLIIIMCAYFIQ